MGFFWIMELKTVFSMNINLCMYVTYISWKNRFMKKLEASSYHCPGPLRFWNHTWHTPFKAYLRFTFFFWVELGNKLFFLFVFHLNGYKFIKCIIQINTHINKPYFMFIFFFHIIWFCSICWDVLYIYTWILFSKV